MGPLAIPLITAGTQLLGGAMQGIMGYKAQEKTNKANMELAKYSYSKDLEMWNRGNVYNAPEAQMERLKAAGLNPNLVYGSGSAAGQSAGQLPKYNAPTVDYNYVPPIQETMGNVLSQYQDFQIKQAQVNNLREQNKVIRETGIQKDFMNQYMPEFLEGRNFGQGMKNYWGNMMNQNKELSQRIGLKYQEQLGGSQLEYQKGKVRMQSQAIDNMIKQGAKLDASTDYQNKVNEWYLTKMFSQLGMQAIGTIGKALPTGKALSLPKTIPPPWRGNLKVNPRSRRIPSAGAVNP